jgi:transient-receptor-potential-like protein
MTNYILNVVQSHFFFQNFHFQRRMQEKERDNRYTNVVRSLVWRYVCATARKMEENPVTEDDVNEVKTEISAMRFEMLEVFEKNGMDVSFTDKREKSE